MCMLLATADSTHDKMNYIREKWDEWNESSRREFYRLKYTGKDRTVKNTEIEFKCHISAFEWSIALNNKTWNNFKTRNDKWIFEYMK